MTKRSSAMLARANWLYEQFTGEKDYYKNLVDVPAAVRQDMGMLSMTQLVAPLVIDELAMRVCSTQSRIADKYGILPSVVIRIESRYYNT